MGLSAWAEKELEDMIEHAALAVRLGTPQHIASRGLFEEVGEALEVQGEVVDLRAEVARLRDELEDQDKVVKEAEEERDLAKEELATRVEERNDARAEVKILVEGLRLAELKIAELEAKLARPTELGTLCSQGHRVQISGPSGVTCPNGHAGAEALNEHVIPCRVCS
jgi:predicted RNase H-like nuclease (RuvC/YqgF family)